MIGPMQELVVFMEPPTMMQGIKRNQLVDMGNPIGEDGDILPGKKGIIKYVVLDGSENSIVSSTSPAAFQQCVLLRPYSFQAGENVELHCFGARRTPPP